MPLTLMPASLSAWATPTSASLLTAAVLALPRDARYSTLSNTSLMVKLRISMPMRPTSGAATSRTSWANWSRSRYTSSTVSVPGGVQSGLKWNKRRLGLNYQNDFVLCRIILKGKIMCEKNLNIY